MKEQQLLNKIISEELSRLLTPRNRPSLNENKTDRQVNNIIKQHSPTSNFDEIRQIRALFLNQIPNARSRNQKWICTVLQWWYDGEIPGRETKKLNKFLGWLNSHDHPDPQVNNTDWSHLTFQDIRQAYLEMFPETPPQTVKGDRRKVKHINGFTIRRIDSDDEAQELGCTAFNNEWCIFGGQFDMMVGDCTCYVITNDRTYSTAEPMDGNDIITRLREMGLDDVADTVEENFEEEYELEDCDEYFEVAYGHDAMVGNDPLKIGLMPFDTYGLSAIAVIVGEDGELYDVQSRYNLHTYDGELLNKQQLSRLIQHDINDACPYVAKTQPQQDTY